MYVEKQVMFIAYEYFRCMAVLDPIKVIITNFSDSPAEIQVPNFPADVSKGHHTIPIDGTMYIERDDFREVRNNKIYVFSSFISAYIGSIIQYCICYKVTMSTDYNSSVEKVFCTWKFE